MFSSARTKLSCLIQQGTKTVSPIILVTTLIASCGGGNQSSPSTSDNTPQISSSSIKSESSSTFSSNTAESTSSSTSSNENGSRVANIFYDLDNNGVYEGNRRFRYDIEGRVIAEDYTYVDDTIEDADFGRFSIGAPAWDETTLYTYNADGTISFMSVADSTWLTEFRYEYDANRNVEKQFLNFFKNGNLEQSISYEMTNNNNQLIRWDLYMSPSISSYQSDELTLNANGQIEKDVLTQTQGGKKVESSYTYNSLGKILNIQRIDGFYQNNIDFEYDANNRIVARISRADAKNTAYRWIYYYNASGHQSEWLIDLLDDGSTQAKVRIEYESGPCKPVFIWAPRSEPNFIASPNLPYAPGSGYAQVPVCAQL